MTNPPEPFDVGIVGGGWSAWILAAVAAAGGRKTALLEPWCDPDALPRPFPLPDDHHWHWLREPLAWREEGRDWWATFGGAVARPLSERRLADAEHRTSARAEGGALITESTMHAWAWSEPRSGYASLAERVATRLADLGVVRESVAWPPRVETRWFRRNRPAVKTQARQWILLAPASEQKHVQAPGDAGILPRYGLEPYGAWWMDAFGTVLRIRGRFEPLPPGYERRWHQRGELRSGRPWGLVDSWRCQVATVPAPTVRPPAEWAAWLWQLARPWSGEPHHGRFVKPVATGIGLR